jgi:hypothetical protein
MIYNISNRTEAPAIQQNNIVVVSKIKTHNPKSNSKKFKKIKIKQNHQNL